MDRTKIKIICNPYEKIIEYRRWGEKNDRYEWVELSDQSELIKEEKYAHATIQHNAYEIVDEIAREYNTGNVGLDIIFEGTEEDYEDLRDIVESYYSEKNIGCECGEYYIDSAKEVMPKIQGVYTNMLELFDKYNADKVKEILRQFTDATETVIPICVVGLYSAGKSAFINALIGDEILPSAANPTTARIYRVIETEYKGEIEFSVFNEKVLILFENDKNVMKGNVEKNYLKS